MRENVSELPEMILPLLWVADSFIQNPVPTCNCVPVELHHMPLSSWTDSLTLEKVETDGQEAWK